MEESKVTGIIQSLTGLEDDLDSLNSKVAEMKKQLSIKAQTEIDTLLEKTREMATKEAEVIINTSKEKAKTESTKISQEGEAKLSETTSQIDTNFDEAVRHVVSTVLKA
ncbi:MAG: conserved oligomeric Golgi complex subunit 6 [Nitrosopumilus sp.]|nr:conserved oligomeric Golgi complex subunit 6 [Nitrosopumilus sp.]